MVQAKKKIRIAIDGPASAGKSTLAKKVAQKLSLLYIDTGAMYRALAYACLSQKVDIQNETAVENFLPSFDLKMSVSQSEAEIFVLGENVTEKIRKNEISQAASDVSKYKAVRLKMVELQRQLAEGASCILDGRDIASAVLPQAEVKIFLTASLEERARRRVEDLKARGEQLSFEEVKDMIALRDQQDMTREFSPLKQVPEAVLIDTSTLTLEESVQKILEVIEQVEASSLETSKKKKTECKEKKEEPKGKNFKHLQNMDLSEASIPSRKTWRELLIALAKPIVKLIAPFELHHPENAPQEGPCLYIANHVAIYDIPVMIFPVKKNWIFWVNKSEVITNAFVAKLFSLWRTIVVDVDKVEMTTLRQMMTRLKQKQIIGIFPQSTRIKTQEKLKQFPPKAGILFFAQKVDCPLYPVMIDGTFSFFKKTHVYFGKPFKLNVTKEDIQENQEKIGFQVMQEIFSLAGRDYYKEMDREDLRGGKNYITYDF